MKTKLLSILTILTLNIQAQDIHRVACDGNLVRLDSMLQYTDLHTLDDQGRTLLHWAVGCNQKEVFDVLVQQGIEIEAVDRDGFSSLYVALQFNRESLFDTLLTLLPSDEWKINEGASLIEKAILDSKIEYLKKLIANGVNIEAVNKRGSTPLEISQRIGDEEISDWLISKGADQSKVRKFELRGKYMGQEPPGSERKLFAPNFISTEQHEFGAIFNSAGDEFYFAIDVNRKPIIKFSKLVDGVWSQPETILSHDLYGYNDPFLSPEEDRLYFISKRAMDGVREVKDHDIWYVEKQGAGWSEPINAGTNINSEGNEYYISFTKEGTMYFASNKNAPEERKRYDQDIYFSENIDGEFQEAIRLGEAINTENYEADVFIDPKEEYLIFCSTRPEGMGRGDLYISFKGENGSWTNAVNMGKQINTEYHELCPIVTPDGKYLMYTSNQDIYWISTEVLDEFRK